MKQKDLGISESSDPNWIYVHIIALQLMVHKQKKREGEEYIELVDFKWRVTY